MTKHPTAPAAEPSVADSERAVSEAAAELGDIRLKIAEAEAELPKLAQSDDDEAFEAKSLEIERLRRSKMRAAARLEQAKASLTEAKANKKEGRRRSLLRKARRPQPRLHALLASMQSTPAQSPVPSRLSKPRARR